MSEAPPKWEAVCHGLKPGRQTMRLKVPGGWLYNEGDAVVFVANPMEYYDNTH